MSDHYIGLDLFDLENNGLRQPISRITLYRGDNAALTAGDDTGLEVVADCIYVTQEMVDALLSAARGYQYHAYSAQAARLNPAAELGDTVEVGSIVSVLAQISDNGDLYPDIAAPGDREVEDEYPAAGPLTKAFDKKLAEARSEITKTTDQIALAIYGEDGKGGLNGKMATFTVSLSTIDSKVESVETKAAEDLEAAKKALEEDIAGLDQSFSDALRNLGNDFAVQLSKYSTVEQTDEKIATEVKSVKTYTNGKVEELDLSVSLKLDKYSTIEQTDSKIQSTVSSNAEYTNRQVDNLGNAVIKQLSKYSTIEQTDEKIATRVAKGSIISEINQSAETVQISASKINLNGYVTFTSLSEEPTGTLTIDGGWLHGQTISSAIFTGGEYWDDKKIGCLDLSLNTTTVDGTEVTLPWLTYSAINSKKQAVNLFEVKPLTANYEWIGLFLGDTLALDVWGGVVSLSSAWNMVAGSKNYGEDDPPETAVEGQVYFKLIS